MARTAVLHRGLSGLCVALCATASVAPAADAATRKPAPKRPNLTVSSLLSVPVTAAGGRYLTVTDTTRNRGNATAKKSATGAYFSVNPKHGAGDIRLGSRVIPALKAGRYSKAKLKVRIPSDTPAGAYYLIVCADDGSKNRESSESDNCRRSTRRLQVAGGPDAPKTAIPPTPTITGVSPNSPANNNTIVVTGSARADLAVRVVTNGDCSGTPAGKGVAAQFTSPGFSVAVPDNATTTLSAFAVDDFGNVSKCSAPVTYVEDSAAPPTPTLTGPPSPANGGQVTLSGSTEAGASVRLYVGAGCPGTPLTVGSAATYATGFSVGVGRNAATPFSSDAVDAAGNRSGCSATYTYTEDSIAPAAPVLSSTNPASPSNNPAPKLTGSAEAGSTVDIYRTVGVPSQCETTPLGASVPAATLAAGTTLATIEGPQGFAAKARDAAGNVSPCSNSLNYLRDTKPTGLSTSPSAPMATMPSPDHTPEVKGTTGPGLTVQIFASTTGDATCPGTPVATGTSEAFGNTGITVTLPVSGTVQQYTFSAKAFDSGGTSMCSQTSAAPTPGGSVLYYLAP